jgi:hypothetical protein
MMLPVVLVFICYAKSDDWFSAVGKGEFFANLPPEMSRRHFWDGTGLGVDTEKSVLFIKSGKTSARYDLAAIRSIEKRFFSGGQIVVIGGGGGGFGATAYNDGVAQGNAQASGLFFTMRDLDHPIWQVRFRTQNDLNRWYEVFSQLIGD